MSAPHRYFIINKPPNMVSQFVSPHPVRLLGHLDFFFPEGTHAVGRLDHNSEGLLILTTNKRVTQLLFQSGEPHQRTYLVQVNNQLSAESLEQLQQGVRIRTGSTTYYTTPPCAVVLVDCPETIYPFVLNKNDYGTYTWLLITLTEGKYRQVRKMMMAVRHRVKRLIRVSIENLRLDSLPPGGVQEIPEPVFFENLRINYP